MELRTGEGRARMQDLALWLGRARLREHELEALMAREGLDPAQQDKLAALLGRLRSEIRSRLDRVNRG